ncbi:MAG: pyridine nucleotide-disulfide oxidoreductase [Dehalococcoidia bacterium]|nr:pyridine nucleotide-disulfide oxidoreductase [Dehalococcoidia bacterium]
MADATVLILGSGVGGLVCANELRRRLDRSHRIVLIDRQARHVFWPNLLWLAVGTRKPEEFVRDLAPLERKGIEVIKANVERIDPAQRKVWAEGREISADYIVVSLGAELAPQEIPGLSDAGHNLYTIEGATALRDARLGLRAGKVVILITRTPFKCPAAPYEEAMLMEYDARKRKVRQNMEYAIYTPEPGPMSVTGPENSSGVRRLVEERGINYYPQHQIERVDPSNKRLHFTNGVEASYDLLVYIPPHTAPKVALEAGLTGPSGWVLADKHTLATKFDGVFAIGDVVGIPLSVGMPLPKAGVFAHGEAVVVAHNIALAIQGGRGQPMTFNGHGECFVEVGDGKAGLGRGDFYAEPRPQVKLFNPGRHWHAGKVLFEKHWMRQWF